ncbi:MATE family efflux transporter [Catenibacterium sp.]|uniref:MATE family efflux transporter n=1 Tax=Catenibacterium sp. TaxID=2049022 RepID=UPI003993AE10
MGLQYSITAIGSMVMQGANNFLGATYMSAFAAAAKIKQLAICPFDALATAASTFASQNYGAKKYDRIKKRSHTNCCCRYYLWRDCRNLIDSIW